MALRRIQTFVTLPAILFILFNVWMLTEYSMLQKIQTVSDLDIIPIQQYFFHTCLSFPMLCQDLQVIDIFTIKQFNQLCKSIFTKVINKIETINPLFILSFRREFISMLNITIHGNNDINSYCNHSFIHNLFKTYDDFLETFDKIPTFPSKNQGASRRGSKSNANQVLI